ncbi:MAG: DUF2207 domain-containing protein [Gemmatimonadota bacterium]
MLESFESDIRVLRSGRLEVSETLRPRFEGSYKGIFRMIPVEYRTGGNFAYKLRIKVQSVTDGEGRDLRYELSREGRYRKVKIWIPGASNATRTVILRYRVENGLRFFGPGKQSEEVEEAYDELYWNVTGDEWPVPIESAGATVHLPVDVTGIRARAFTGAYGSRQQDTEVRVDGPVVRVASRRPLSYREGLTIGIAWDPGVVKRPTAAERAAGFLAANWPLLLPLLAFFYMLRLWRAKGRDPAPLSITPQYEPPDGMTPAEVGVVIDNSPDMRDITATIVDLAVRGYLRIEEKEEKKLLGLVSDRDYSFHLRKDPGSWTELRPHELRLLGALFKDGATQTRLSDLENEFYRDLPGIKSDLRDVLVERGVYPRRPERIVAQYAAAGLLAGALIAAGGLVLSERLGLAPSAVILAAVLTGGVIIGFGVVMPARTRTGARLWERVRGFEEFLNRVESDRFKRMVTGPEMFEKFLPFAMALGVEKKWAAAFDDLYREPPDWYVGSGLHTFQPSFFVADLGRMSTRAASAMRTAPRSSGGSSFGGGGGFSGGGFGGGGGGAF